VATFADTYREIVTPILRERCRYHGFLLALGDEGFAEAHDAVTAIAYDKGAASLPDSVQFAIDEWIGAQILKHCDEFTPQIQESINRADRIAADVRRVVAEWTMKR